MSASPSIASQSIRFRRQASRIMPRNARCTLEAMREFLAAIREAGDLPGVIQVAHPQKSLAKLGTLHAFVLIRPSGME